MVEDKKENRDKMLREFSLKIAKCEGIKVCNTRMRTILNAAALGKIWPDFMDYVDNSWKLGEEEDDSVIVVEKPNESQNKEKSTSRY